MTMIQALEKAYNVRIYKARRGWFFVKKLGSVTVSSRDFPNLMALQEALKEQKNENKG